jgi:hypothetical protein
MGAFNRVISTALHLYKPHQEFAAFAAAAALQPRPVDFIVVFVVVVPPTKKRLV